MRRSAPRPKPVFLAHSELEARAHFAKHVDALMKYPMTRVTPERLEELSHSTDPDKARGTPSSFCYDHGVLRVWPWPAEGWQVWAENHLADPKP